MKSYVSVIFLAFCFTMASTPHQVSAASITETKAAIGKGCIASGDNSTAMGNSTTASGESSTAMGVLTVASGEYSTAMGLATHAIGSGSTAMGYRTAASGDHSLAGGTFMRLTDTADHTFVWGHSDYTAQWITTANAFLIFPAGTAGKVGIRTESPNEVLEVAGDGRAFFGDGGGPNRKGLLIDGIEGNTAARLEAYDYGLTTGLNLVINTYGGGNVGIGTTSPDYRLEVAGNAAKTSGGTTWINSSDVRLKDITGEYKQGLDKILSIKPVTFYYKADNPRDLPTDEENIGFVAQEVQEVFPEAVTEGPDGYLDFNMHPVNVAVVNAIKELKAENDEIRSENEYLRVENAMLKKDIEKIKAILGI